MRAFQNMQRIFEQDSKQMLNVYYMPWAGILQQARKSMRSKSELLKPILLKWNQ